MKTRITAICSAIVFLTATTSRSEIVIRSKGLGDGTAEVGILAEIDATGNAFSSTTQWEVTGAVQPPGAFGGSVRVRFDAIKNVSVDPATLGDKLTAGTIERDDAALIGVTGNPNGGGIGADATNREGLEVRFDEINGMNADHSLRITHINVRNVGRTGTDPVGTESFTVVNLQTRQSMVVVPAAGSEGDFDVSSLNLVRAGNSTGPMATIYSGNTGGFRVGGITLEIQEGNGDPKPWIRTFAANDTRVSSGDDVRLSWGVTGAQQVSISPGAGAVINPSDGHATVSPTETTTYTLTATNEAGTSNGELTVHVDATRPTAEGPYGSHGIRHVSGELAVVTSPQQDLRSGALERHSMLHLFPEKSSVSLDTTVPLNHLASGPATLPAMPAQPGNLPSGAALNSYLFHADLPAGAPPAVFCATVTFESPVVGISHGQGLETTDAPFALDGTLFSDSALRESIATESTDEVSIGPDGHTVTITFRLGDGPDTLDQLRVITSATATPAPASAPNIVLFLADDMGIGDTSSYQDWSGIDDARQIATPEMERLADLGVRFTDAHAQNRCTPTRYALLTGRYAWRAGLLKGVLMGSETAPLVDRGRPTLPAFLKSNGYSTGMVGKWHLGMEYRQNNGMPSADWSTADFTVAMRDNPLDHGLDFFHGFSRSHLTSGPDGMDGNTPGQSVGPGWIRNRRVAGATGRGKELDGSYQWDTIGQTLLDEGRGFMQSHLGNSSSRTRPFFLYFASHANHTVYSPDAGIDGIPVSGQSRWKSQSLTGDKRRDFVHLNDVLLGRLMSYLETTEDPRNPGAKLIENTLVIFTSDNGSDVNEQRAVGNLRAYKAHIYEGGHRVPLIAYWKNGGIGDAVVGNGGTNRDDLIALQDLYPTISGLIGRPLDAPASSRAPAVDGFALPMAFKNQPIPPRPSVLTNENNGNTWLALQYKGTIPVNPPKTGYWKIIFDNSLIANSATRSGNANPLELYNLETDRLETANLIGNPEYDGLKTWLSAWAERIVHGDGAREPVPEIQPEISPEQSGIRISFPASPFWTHELWTSEELRDWAMETTLQSAEPATLSQDFPVDRPRRFFQIRSRQ